jgi:hypothetical protein
MTKYKLRTTEKDWFEKLQIWSLFLQKLLE